MNSPVQKELRAEKGVDIDFKSTSDGWRGTLADNFTFNNVGRIALAIAKFVEKNQIQNKILIGFDTRFMSREFSVFFAKVVQSRGVEAVLMQSFTPTPLLSFAVNRLKYSLGVNITASHNPPYDNGIKIRMNYGGAPSKNTVNTIESLIEPEFKIQLSDKPTKIIDPRKDYASELLKFVDLKRAKNGSNILVDTMHGTTYGLLKKILRGSVISVDYINNSFDPNFGGMNPEPKFESTKKLQDIVKKGGYSFGVAHDGDGDRIVSTIPSVGYLSPHDLAAMLVVYLAKYKNLSGKVIGSSTISRRLRRVCEYLNLEYISIPVGFKNATEIMLKEKVLLAAEENGGIGFGFYLPERDATLVALMLLDAEINVPGLLALYKEVEKISGKSGFCRDSYVSKGNYNKIFEYIISTKGKDFGWRAIEKITTIDGIKINYKNGDWLGLRISGTEGVIRVYCEAETYEKAKMLRNVAFLSLEKIKDKV